MTSALKYNLTQINDISNSGFQYEIPQDSYDMINYLAEKIGAIRLTNSLFVKPSKRTNIISSSSSFADTTSLKNKKKKGNKGMEITDEEWDTIRTFETTKIEQKTGINCEIDQLRLLLNKLTDKTYLDIFEKITNRLNSIFATYTETDDLQKVSNIIYDLCSSNKFYSKIFADLFANLCQSYPLINELFKEKMTIINEQYNNIQYIDSDVDYDGFCDMNKINEKRRSVTMFYVNLAKNNFIKQEIIANMLQNVLSMIIKLIYVAEKKNEVDELAEHVAIIIQSNYIEIFEEIDDDYSIENVELDETYTLLEPIYLLAKAKSKDYKSLSNKTIFKFMDLAKM